MENTQNNGLCETLHGLPCEGTVELPEHIDAQLPPGELVEYAQVISIDYRWPHDQKVYTHPFTDAVLLVGGDNVLYVVGNFTTQPEGIINLETE
jgi:hypothetical protein